MKTCLALILFLTLCQPGASGQSSFADPRAVMRAEQAGLDFPEIPNSPETNFTQTRHHRFGRETGIGSSYLGTTSATTEDMPTIMYKPTAVSPAIQPSLFSPAFKEINRQWTYSQLLTTPALGSTQTRLPTIGGELKFGSNSLQNMVETSPALQGFTLPLRGETKRPGAAFGKQLVQPDEGL